MKTHTLLPPPELLSPGLEQFLLACDEIVDAAQIPTAATTLRQGKLTLWLGDLYRRATPAVRAEILRHEAGHFLCDHHARMGKRGPQAWNAVTDASLHETECCDWRRIEAEAGIEMVTFNRLHDSRGRPLPPMPPEMAYELLPKVGISQGCGSSEHSSSDNHAASHAKRAVVVASVLVAEPGFVSDAGAGAEPGPGRTVPELPPPPTWIYQVLDYLLRGEGRTEPCRSWRREHRSGMPMLPGQSQGRAYAGHFLIDASGSIGPKVLGQFLAAVVATPELASMDVVVFDHGWSEPIPVTSVQAILDEVSKRGGGTAIRAVGQAMRPPGMPVVWLTDGQTGDGWPDPHDGPEVWVMSTSVTPPHGVVVRA